MGNNAAKIPLTSRQSAILEPLARVWTAPQRLVERCRIVLMSAEGRNNEDQGKELDVDRQRVRRWRGLRVSASGALGLAEHEGATDKVLEKLIVTVVADDARSGTPAKFTPERVAAIVALACEPPAQSGLPVSHWTPTELAREAIKRKIVATISPRHVDRFFSEAGLRPNKSQYWLTSRDKRDAPAQYQTAVENICSTYRDAPKLAAEGTHVVSTDEKTGMQALQRLHETKPVRPGLIERVEHE